MEPLAYAEIQEQEPSHWWYRGMRTITQTLLDPVIGQRRDLRILDVGCGVGGNLTHLRQWGQPYGCDYSPLALHYAATAHAGRLCQATVEQLPYASASFDLVTCFDVLYCREVTDDGVALAEIARVLAPNGILLLRLPALRALAGWHDHIVHGVRRYTRSEVRAKLHHVALTPVRITYANSLLLPLIFLTRKLQRLRTAPTQFSQSDVRQTPTLVNTLFYQCLRIEAAWIDHGRTLPLGVSVIAVAQKVNL